MIKVRNWQTINNVYSALRKYFREVIHAEWTTKKNKRPQRAQNAYVRTVALINLTNKTYLVKKTADHKIANYELNKSPPKTTKISRPKTIHAL